MKRIGILWGGDMSDVSRFRDAFRQELRDLGQVEGQNIVIEERYIKGSAKSLSDLTAELIDIGINVDVIVASGTPAARAARDATTTIPIVFAAVGDPSLVQATNVTGVRLPEPELSGKRLKVLKEAVPSVTRVAVLWNVANPVHKLSYLEEMKVVASTLGITLVPLPVGGPDELDSAFNALTMEPPDAALIVCPDPMFHSQRPTIMSIAVRMGLPAMYSQRTYVEEGGLMAYGPNYPDMFRQAAALVNSILNGTDPSELDIEQVRSSELVINLNTARRIGCTISESVLARATVIN